MALFLPQYRDWDLGWCILCQKDSSSLLLDLLVTGIIQFADMSIRKTNDIEEFHKSEVPFRVGILVHLNELQKGNRIIENLKKGKAK